DRPGQGLVCLVPASLDGHGLARDSVAAIATIDRRVDHPALRALARALGRSVQGYASSALAGVAVPSPSPAVEDAVGTPSVAEAAALLAAGSGSRLLVPKRRSASATVAVARRAGTPGRGGGVGRRPG